MTSHMLTPDQQLNEAISLAVVHHAGLKDKAGSPFIMHIMRVALAGAPNNDLVVVGFLHDIVEDTEVTLGDLIEMGFPPYIVDAVDAMTRRKGEDYFEYVLRATKNPLALRVKHADLLDNMAPWRQTFPGAKTLLIRHGKALGMVEEALRAAA